MRARTATALFGLVGSLALSLILWWLFGTLLVFLFLPFLPFLFRGRDEPTVRRCPRCNFETRQEDYEFCPRDGERLQGNSAEEKGDWQR